MENGKAPEQETDKQPDIVIAADLIARVEASLTAMREQRAELDQRILRQEGALNILVMARDGKIPPVNGAGAAAPPGTIRVGHRQGRRAKAEKAQAE